jgi:mannose-6-phosphate isomerase-like protein (cupin superfamily)
MRPVVNAKEVVTYESPTPDHRKFRVLVDRDQSGSKSVAAGHLLLPPGAFQANAEAHPDTEEIYYCARGRGKLLLDEEEYLLEEGTAAYVGPGVLHQVFNTGDEELLMVWFESPPSCEVGGYKPMKLGWKQIPGAGQ